MQFRFRVLLFLPLFFLPRAWALTGALDLSQATLVSLTKQSAVASTVLCEEMQRRTGIQLKTGKRWPSGPKAVIVMSGPTLPADTPSWLRDQASRLVPAGAEGFGLYLTTEPQPVALIIANDERGFLYGIGKLLRLGHIKKGSAGWQAPFTAVETPQYLIRGHQLGYRPKTNSYDAWSVAQFDRYIRELALFGANSIEIMPPRTDDDPQSVHMTVAPMTMMIAQSGIAGKYGLDVWIWYPNMGKNYSHPDSIKKELAERETVFRQLPRVDAVFVPGGDPGDLHPDELFAWLQQMAGVLHTYHPAAKIWVSPQAFKPTTDWMESFISHTNRKYSWFGGVVFGPWVPITLPDLRKAVRTDIPIRHYPDITHSLSCQFPVPQWDLAFAMTLGRECYNPRPLDEKHIHNLHAPFCEGSLSYSEGINDDVNKFVWSDQDWNPETPVMETLRDYARLFIDPDHADDLALAFMNQEKNWRGPLLRNESVTTTLQQWQALEKNAPAAVLSNYRFQMGLLRAYYDAYIQRRLAFETELEHKAMDVLRQARADDARLAAEKAMAILLQARNQPPAAEWRDRCVALADSVYKNIGSQLTIKKHHAMSGRGNFMDNIDIPLNDAIWLLAGLKSALAQPGNDPCFKSIAGILHRTDPGPGGYYDNLGSPSSWTRVGTPLQWDQDPGGLSFAQLHFGVGLQGEEWVHEVVANGFEGRPTPLAWAKQVGTHYGTPLQLKYDHLDPTASYRIRVAYTGRFRASIKLVADDSCLVHDYTRTGVDPALEFDVPPAATRDGSTTLTFLCAPGERGTQIAEIWLYKN